MLMILDSIYIYMLLMMVYPMGHWPWVYAVKVTRKGEGRCNFWPIFSKFDSYGHIVSSRLDMLMILGYICMFLMMGYPMEHWPRVCEVKVTHKSEGQSNFWAIFIRFHTLGHIVSSRLDNAHDLRLYIYIYAFDDGISNGTLTLGLCGQGHT